MFHNFPIFSLIFLVALFPGRPQTQQSGLEESLEPIHYTILRLKTSGAAEHTIVSGSVRLAWDMICRFQNIWLFRIGDASQPLVSL